MNTRLTGAASRLVIAGVLLWTLAGATYALLRATFGPRPVFVHVRWAPETASAQRGLEQRYRLTQRQPLEGRTFGYTLIDTSHDNIRAMVSDAAVEDTHYIHRMAFRPWRFAPRRPYPTPYPRVPAGLEALTALLVLAGAAAFGLAFLEIAAPGLVRGPLRVSRQAFVEPRATFDAAARRVAAWLGGRIPAASAEAVALFRIVFGSALLLIVLRRPVRGEWAASPANVISDAQRWALWIFVEAPRLADWIAPWVLFWGVLFIAGAAARTAFAMFAAGVFAWALLHTTETTYHSVAALLLTLICLLPARWGDAWSVDALPRRAGPFGPAGTRRSATPQTYGYAIWAPGFVLGVTFLAAAIAKLRESGMAWILNGTVKYHFLSDSGQARVDWGLDLAPHAWIAVALSFGAIAIETFVIAGVFSRTYIYRLAAGMATLCLLTGFALFQGIVWPGWWVLLLSFLPWHLIRPATSRLDTGRSPAQPWRRLLQPAGVIVVIGVIAGQTIISLLRLEVSPLISTYDMYATTYASPAEYEQKAGQSYWIVATDDNQGRHDCRIAPGEAKAMLEHATVTPSRAAQVPRRCFEPSVRVRRVELEARRPRIDWTRWRPEAPVHVPLASFEIDDETAALRFRSP